MSRCNTVKNRAGNQQMDSSLPTVYELAQRRLKFLFEAFDNIYVSFSGGKDSSVLLNLCIDYIRRHGLDRKIGVFHMDYEIQYRDTVAHVDQVLASNADILEVYRVCVPFKVPTCTSMFQPYWRPWEESKSGVVGAEAGGPIRAKFSVFFGEDVGLRIPKPFCPVAASPQAGRADLLPDRNPHPGELQPLAEYLQRPQQASFPGGEVDPAV